MDCGDVPVALVFSDRIDSSEEVTDNTAMKTIDTITEQDADLQSILERITSGKRLGPETYQRIRERGRHITEDLRKEYGEMNIAVDLIRQIRDEE
jgi:hypothetical protein